MEDDRQRRVRDVSRWAALLAAMLLVSVAVGVSTARTDAGLGPHMARYEMTLDHAVTVDLGPLGTLVVDSPLPLTLGVHVVVQEIPREVTALQGVDTLDALLNDLESYLQFFSAPGATVEVAVRGLVWDATRRTVLTFGGLLGAVLLVRAAMGRPRRHEVVRTLQPHRKALTGAVTVVVVVAATVTAGGTEPPGSARSVPASTVFDGTALEGARVTGRLAGVIDTYGGYVVDAYRDNEEFYARARSNLEQAWVERVAADAEIAELRAALRGTLRTPEAAEGGAAGAQDPATPGGGDSPVGPTPMWPGVVADPAELVTAVVVADLHCNVGMAPVIGAVVELVDAGLVLNAGDTTTNGTAVESYCVTAFARAIPSGVPVVVSDGNHDSSETSAQERAVGWTVLDGQPVEVAGVRILGDTDPRATRVGTGTTLAGQETLAEVDARLSEVACEEGADVDLLLVHDSKMAATALAEGCAPALVAGHMHRRIGPVRVGEGVQYVSSSTAGAVLGRPTVGPLHGVAEMTVLRFDPEGRIVDYRLVRIYPDADVTVGFPVRWPGTRPESVLGPGVR